LLAAASFLEQSSTGYLLSVRAKSLFFFRRHWKGWLVAALRITEDSWLLVGESKEEGDDEKYLCCCAARKGKEMG
jgi:hypothetical protein